MLTFRGRKSSLTGLAFSPDGQLLAACGYRGIIQVWDLAQRSLLHKYSTGEYTTNRFVSFTANGDELAVQVYGGLYVINLLDGKRTLHRPTNRDYQCYLGCVSADRRQACLAFMDTDYRRISQRLTGLALHQLPRGARIWELPPLASTGWLSTLSFSFNGKSIATGSTAGTIAVREARSGTPLCEIKDGPPSEVKAIALSPDGKLVAWGAAAHLLLWRVDPLEEIAHHSMGRTHFQSVAWHPSGDFFATANGDGKVDYWDGRTGEHRQAFDWQVGKLNEVTFESTGDRASCCSQTGEIVVWDVDR